MAETKEIIYDQTYLDSLEALDAPDATEEFDPDSEYALPPPAVEDGWYFMTFANGGVFTDGNKVPYRSAQWANEHRPHFEIAIVGEIQAPDIPLIHEKRIYTDMPLTTTPDPKRNNASAVGAAFRAFTGKPIAGLPGLSHVKQLDEVLKGRPTGWGRVQNALHDTDAEKDFGARKKAGQLNPGEKRPQVVYGQKRIAALPGGTIGGRFTGAADHPQSGVRCVAKAVLVEFKPADFTPPAKAAK